MTTADTSPDASGRTATVQSLARGLAVLETLGRAGDAMSLSDVARDTGLTRAAARRFLLTLVRMGYVRGDARQFALRTPALELGRAYLSSLRLPGIARPHMAEFVSACGESCSLAVLDHEDVVYVERVPTRRIMNALIHVGTRLPAYATSMGRVLLVHQPPDVFDATLHRLRLEPLTPHTITDRDALRAELRRVARDGVSVVDQELELGVLSMAVPVESAGRVVAAINVPTHSAPGGAASLRHDLLPGLRATAAAISADLAAAA